MPLPDPRTQPLPVLAPDARAPGTLAGVDPGQPGPATGGALGGCLLRLVVLAVAAACLLVGAALIATTPRQTLLILGSDARPDEIRRGEAGRTDTLLVLVADRATPQVAMISVPRDLWVPVAGHGEERLNAAFVLGGAGAAKQTVANVLGLPIGRYALVGLQGVRDVVDAVGGVHVTVEQAIYDPAYPTDDYGVVEITIPAGRQHMDGETALRYARTRHQDSDFGRVARQQRVLTAVRSALLNPLNWPRLPAVAVAVQRSVQTDLTPLDVVAIGAAFVRAPGDPDRLVVDTTLVQPMTGQSGAYLLAPTPALPRAVARLVGGGQVSVEVLNAAGVAGLARTTADRLEQAGFDVARVGDAERPQERTSLVARPGARRAADTVAAALGVSADRVAQSADLPPGVDVRVLAGGDLAR